MFVPPVVWLGLLRDNICRVIHCALTTSCLTSLLSLLTPSTEQHRELWLCDTTRLSQFLRPSAVTFLPIISRIFLWGRREWIIVGVALINLILLFMILINLNACISWVTSSHVTEISRTSIFFIRRTFSYTFLLVNIFVCHNLIIILLLYLMLSHSNWWCLCSVSSW